MSRNRKAARYGQHEHVRLMLTSYPPHSHFRTLVVAGGRLGTGVRYIRFRCSVDNPDRLRLVVEVLVEWAHQHSDHVWLDESVMAWVGLQSVAVAG